MSGKWYKDDEMRVRFIGSKINTFHEREKMTSKLRYEILRRDGFRCVLCGRDANDGIKLHVDHIVPVIKGGLTNQDNLRTLCSDCNRGKGAGE